MYLLSLKMSGIKNIEDDIEFYFYKKTLRGNENFNSYRIKAIYGENGCGKSAVITAVKILKNIISSPDYLSNPTKQKYLDEVINKKTSKFFIECDFCVTKNGKNSIYRYGFILEKNIFNMFEISKEYLYFKSGNNRKHLELIFNVENGEAIFCDLDDETKELVINKTKNLLKNNSFLQLALTNILVLLPQNIGNSLKIDAFMQVLYFSWSLKVFLPSDLQGELSDFKQSGIFKNLTAFSNKDYERFSKMIEINKRCVPKTMYNEYSNKINNMFSFLKLFKNDLKEIKIDRAENVDTYKCSLKLVYDTYSISSENESAGIRRLIDLFDYLYSDEGTPNIVFIDELDTNINDVYLCKLIEYYMYYGKGQLCFTTHNTSPMGILRKNKKSIDFMSTDNKIIEWRKNGNFSPESLYKNGMIEHLPFNIDTTDFIGVLE